MKKFDKLEVVKIVSTVASVVSVIAGFWVSNRENKLTLEKEKMIEECLQKLK